VRLTVSQLFRMAVASLWGPWTPVSPELSCRLTILKNFGYRAMLLPYGPRTSSRDQFC